MLVESNLTELEQQLEQLQAKVIAERQRVKDGTLEAIKNMLASGTITVDDLKALLPHAPARVRPPRTRSSNPRPPKYRDPVSGATWTGQGGMPNWMKGKNADDFLIKAP